MAAHVASLFTVTVAPVSTSMGILFPFMSIMTRYGFMLCSSPFGI